jgi:DNA polymerase bacteriophage-type
MSAVSPQAKDRARALCGAQHVSRLFVDTETRSRTDISDGTDKYSRDAECLIVTYAFETGPAQIWEPWKDPIPPADFWAATLDPDVVFVAHNSSFDRLILLRALGIRIPETRFYCTMAIACAHGLPGSLEKLGLICGLDSDKLKLVDDKGLIDTFCVPQKATNRFIEPWELPNEWQRFCNYALRDTESLRALFERLPTHNYAGDNLSNWRLDQLVNERGFGVDRRLATAATSFLADAKVTSDSIVNEKSGGVVFAASQRNRLLKYLRDRCGIDIESLRASEVREWLEHDDLDPTVRVLLEQRLEAGKSSGAKYRRALELVGPGDRIRHWCRWSGAGRTGRHSARGFQPHNMARPTLSVRRPEGHAHAGQIELDPVKASYIDDVIIPGIYSKHALNEPLLYGGPFEACSLALRHVIVAASGNEIMAGDFKNIESVITAWVAGEQLQLESFGRAFADPKNKSLDVYRIIAGKMLGKPPAEVNESERQMGKVAILAFGFGGGVSALVNMALAYQLDLDVLPDIVLPTATPEQLIKAERAWRRAALIELTTTNTEGGDFGLEKRVYMACDILKQAFRTANSAIDQLRKDMGVAVKAAVGKMDGTIYSVGRCKIFANRSFLVIELPSGRRLLYAAPQLKFEEIKDPEGGKPWTTSYVTYSTARGRGWIRERAWAGLFVENIVQAIANDVLRAAMLRIHAATLSVPAIAAYLSTLPAEARTAINLHVHDEICLDIPKGSLSKEQFLAMLIERPKWALDLPIAADIWINERYGKR